MKVKLVNLEAKALGEVEVSDKIFALKPRADILQRAVVSQRASRRSGTHKTKSRGEIQGTTKKFMNQKGSGGARHGTRKVNIFRSGGTAHGPRPRDYSFRLPKQLQRLALRLALSDRAQGENFFVLEEAQAKGIKTKTVASQLEKLGLASALIIDSQFQREFALSARNLPHIRLLPSDALNVYDILRYEKLVITKTALEKIEERLQ